MEEGVFFLFLNFIVGKWDFCVLSVAAYESGFMVCQRVYFTDIA